MRTWLFERIHPSWVTIGWAVGVIGGMAAVLGWRLAWFASGWWVVAGVLGLGLAIWRPCRPTVGLAVMLGLAMAGWRGSIDLMGRAYVEMWVGQETSVVGTVMEDPDTSEGRTAYRLGRLRWGGSARDPTAGIATAGQIYVTGSANRELRRSDIVEVEGELSVGFGIFVGTLYRPTIKELARPEPGDGFLMVRDSVAMSVKRVIPEPESALGLGYLLGVKSSLPDGLAEALKVVGLTHIVVASGSNLSILVGCARKVFGRTSRFGGLCFALLFVVGYVGMVGLSPSMLRAAIVSVLALMAWYVGREVMALRLLILVAAVTLLYNPMYLIDLGWLLSFGAFAGIMVVSPRLVKFFYGERRPGVVGGTLLETLATSLTCMPILLYYFGTMSLAAPLANLLILPTITPAMGLVFVTGVNGLGAEVLNGLGVGGIGWLMSGVMQVAGVAATKVLDYHLWVIDWLGAQENFVVEITTGHGEVFWLYVPVAGVCAWSWWREHRRRQEARGSRGNSPPRGARGSPQDAQGLG